MTTANNMVYTPESRRARRRNDDDKQPSGQDESTFRARRRRGEEEDEDRTATSEHLTSSGFGRYRRRLERDRYFTQAIDPSSISSDSPPPSPVGCSNMSTTAAGNKLAKEIHDEFLTCKICLEGFKSPKCLDCLHTFCEQCIDNHVLNECTYKKYSDYREFTCPLCRKRTQLPIGGVKKLPDNFLVSSLSEVVARQKPSKFPFCDICKLVSRKHREACSKCIDCNKLLCKQCVDMHKDTKVTQNHSIFDVEIEKDIECKEHQDEVVRFYCEPCQTCICVLCTFNEHKDHEITQFADAVCKYKDNIQQLLSNCKGKIDVYDRQIALLNKCEGVIKSAEQRIKDAALQFINDIKNKEKYLIDELHRSYGIELMQYINRKNEMQNNLEGMKSTCNLTELVLKGKDIELLLLKKQVQEKLSLMANVELKDLPRTVGKQICFVTGNIELGRLEDPDLPIDKKKGVTVNDDQRRLTLPNMMFGQKGSRDQDIMAEVPKFIPKRTVVTQTDPQPKEEVKRGNLVNRCIQTEYPERYDRDNSSNCSSHCGSSSMETRGTGTDTISTLEKAVNTRSAGLQNSANQQQKIQMNGGDTQTSFEENGTGSESPTTRRLRRRRERVKPVEVSVRPTTNYGQAGQTNGYGLGLITYDSSIEESIYNNNDSTCNSTPTNDNAIGLVAQIEVVTIDDVNNVDLGTITTETSLYTTTGSNTNTVTYHNASTSPPRRLPKL